MSRTGIMLCVPFEEKRLSKWTPPYIIQPKLDGVRCRAMIDNAGGVSLLSSEENQIVSVPHITDQLSAMALADVEFDGELYIHGVSFEEISSIVSRTKYLHENFEQMEYHIFDIVCKGDNQFRLLAKDYLFKSVIRRGLHSIKNVGCFYVSNLVEILMYYDIFREEGFEGFVLRNRAGLYQRKRSTNLMKFKPKKQDIYQIIDVTEEVAISGDRKGTLGALICKGDDNTVFKVGTGFSAEQRRLYWLEREKLIGMYALVQYQHITTKGRVPRFPVFSSIMESL